MALPAGLMAMLGGGGAPGGDNPQPPPADAQASPDSAPSGGSSMYGGGGAGGQNTDALRSALDALQAYAQGEDDEQNIQVVHKCVVALQGILANEEKMVDGALGGKADPRAIRRLTGGGGGAGPQY